MATLGGGCIFSPDRSKDPPKDKQPVVYLPRDTAARAVEYLSLAWENRDSVRIDSVYADDYEGTSVDLVDQAQPSFIFHKSDEVHSVGALAQATEITYVDMDLKVGTWNEFHYSTDPPDWWTVQVPYFKIEVRDVLGNGFSATSPKTGESWIFEFTLRPTYPSWANGAPVWEIVKWVESRNKLGQGP
ncbi:MAG TPA: hypothetical protein VJW75_11055 [Candidatus Eisenbacteria bacterium]|nr:hypothetical protein [Candidatus Eisenbacteria bacterium]